MEEIWLWRITALRSVVGIKRSGSWVCQVRRHKEARHQGTRRYNTNPFNGEPMMFKAKPARKIVRARPVKAAKDAV
jgi:hypothetical protein